MIESIKRAYEADRYGFVIHVGLVIAYSGLLLWGILESDPLSIIMWGAVVALVVSSLIYQVRTSNLKEGSKNE